MPEYSSYGLDISSASSQVGGKRMPELVWSQSDERWIFLYRRGVFVLSGAVHKRSSAIAGDLFAFSVNLTEIIVVIRAVL